VVSVQRDFETLDITVLGEVLFKLLGLHVGGDFLDEKIVINESLGVGTEKLIVEGETSAWAAINFEISEDLASFFELLRVRDLNDGGVERFVDISLNLRNALKVNAGFLKDFRNLDGGIVLLREVVQVKKILFVEGIEVCHLVFVLFVFMEKGWITGVLFMFGVNL